MQKRRFWLLKSEPADFAWGDMLAVRVTTWDGVKNYQAQGNLKAASVGDFAFFYHTGAEKAIKGIVKVCREFYIPENDRFGCIDVEFHSALKRSISLQEIKSVESLSSMAILKQPRLSVSEVTPAEWDTIIEMSNQ
ncbi:EVE domain-containing protein [Anaplasma phagocytophilum str. Norway variant1]|uniref:EVE domain-containing protein n=1 Tax=Anaplasma phagocytophilum str. Norway variant1 TaxID=1392506 RepID=A0A7H9E041_ANAPH|nr:EVE domain-containing protein [Anaplasma phagocytophilum]QLL67184.1 EVE domain-containing protein [Anaplasma phagocytophilum str. Norway variant1]